MSTGPPYQHGFADAINVKVQCRWCERVHCQPQLHSRIRVAVSLRAAGAPFASLPLRRCWPHDLHLRHGLRTLAIRGTTAPLLPRLVALACQPVGPLRPPVRPPRRAVGPRPLAQLPPAHRADRASSEPRHGVTVHDAYALGWNAALERALRRAHVQDHVPASKQRFPAAARTM